MEPDLNELRVLRTTARATFRTGMELAYGIALPSHLNCDVLVAEGGGSRALPCPGGEGRCLRI